MEFVNRMESGKREQRDPAPGGTKGGSPKKKATKEPKKK